MSSRIWATPLLFMEAGPTLSPPGGTVHSLRQDPLEQRKLYRGRTRLHQQESDIGDREVSTDCSGRFLGVAFRRPFLYNLTVLVPRTGFTGERTIRRKQR